MFTKKDYNEYAKAQSQEHSKSSEAFCYARVSISMKQYYRDKKTHPTIDIINGKKMKYVSKRQTVDKYNNYMMTFNYESA